MAGFQKVVRVVAWGVLGAVGLLSLGMWALASALNADLNKTQAQNPAPSQQVAAKQARNVSNSARSDAAVACQALVERQAKYDVEFPWFGWDAVEIGGILHIRLTARLQNGFGAMLPHRALCQHRDGQTTLVSIEPGKW